MNYIIKIDCLFEQFRSGRPKLTSALCGFGERSGLLPLQASAGLWVQVVVGGGWGSRHEVLEGLKLLGCDAKGMGTANHPRRFWPTHSAAVPEDAEIVQAASALRMESVCGKQACASLGMCA